MTLAHAPATNGNGLWRKILLPLVPMFLTGLIAWGALRSDVRHIEEALATKANRETVAAQYDAILRELQSLRAVIERRSR